MYRINYIFTYTKIDIINIKWDITGKDLTITYVYNYEIRIYIINFSILHLSVQSFFRAIMCNSIICKQWFNYLLQQLHSEYRSTYTWHEYTGPHAELAVVRRAPQPPLSSKYNIRNYGKTHIHSIFFVVFIFNEHLS